MGRKHMRASAACSVMLLAAAVAGCSSGGSSSSAGNSTGASGNPITIGVMIPNGGPVASFPDSLATVRAAIATFNAEGGVDGRKLQIDWCNDQNDPNKSVACAQQMVSDNVVATLTSSSLIAGSQVSAILEKAGIANVEWLSLVPAEFSAPNTFPYYAASIGMALGGVTVAESTGATKVVFAKADDGDLPDVLPMIDKLGASKDVTGTEVLIPQQGATDYTSYAKQIIDSGAGVVVFGQAKQIVFPLIQAIRQLGGTEKMVLVGGIATQAALQQLGANAGDIYVMNPTPWVDDEAQFPGVKTFVDAMNKEAATGDTGANLKNASLITGSDWASANALYSELKDLAKAGKAITAANFLAGFSKATDLSTGGMAGPWSPSSKVTVPSGYANLSNTTYYLLKYQNSTGEIKLVNNDPVNIQTYLGSGGAS
jgi:ABC-type branched-subunit amino acid transport system substrate-binding protein